MSSGIKVGVKAKKAEASVSSKALPTESKIAPDWNSWICITSTEMHIKSDFLRYILEIRKNDPALEIFYNALYIPNRHKKITVDDMSTHLITTTDYNDVKDITVTPIWAWAILVVRDHWRDHLHLELVFHLLLKAKCNTPEALNLTRVVEKQTTTPLMFVLKHQCGFAVELLCQTPGIDVAFQNNHGISVLNVALMNRQFYAAQLIMTMLDRAHILREIPKVLAPVAFAGQTGASHWQVFKQLWTLAISANISNPPSSKSSLSLTTSSSSYGLALDKPVEFFASNELKDLKEIDVKKENTCTSDNNGSDLVEFPPNSYSWSLMDSPTHSKIDRLASAPFATVWCVPTTKTGMSRNWSVISSIAMNQNMWYDFLLTHSGSSFIFDSIQYFDRTSLDLVSPLEAAMIKCIEDDGKL